MCLSFYSPDIPCRLEGLVAEVKQVWSILRKFCNLLSAVYIKRPNINLNGASINGLNFCWRYPHDSNDDYKWSQTLWWAGNTWLIALLLTWQHVTKAPRPPFSIGTQWNTVLFRLAASSSFQFISITTRPPLKYVCKCKCKFTEPSRATFPPQCDAKRLFNMMFRSQAKHTQHTQST